MATLSVQAAFTPLVLARHSQQTQDQPVTKHRGHSRKSDQESTQSNQTSQGHRRRSHRANQAVVDQGTSAETKQESRHRRHKHGKDRIENKRANKVVEKSQGKYAKKQDAKPVVLEPEEKSTPSSGENQRLARAYNLYDSGANLRLLGNYELAVSRLSEARQLFQMSGQEEISADEASQDAPPSHNRQAAPMETLASFELAQAAEGARNDALAERSYRACISLNPKFLPAYLKLSCLTARQGKTEEALGIARQALSVSPSDPQIHSIIAQLLSALGQTAEARSEEERAAALLQNNRALRAPEGPKGDSN
jgi:tetratricopeptide (TPR) repeat protein